MRRSGAHLETLRGLAFGADPDRIARSRRTHVVEISFLLVFAASFAAASCTSVECGPGTIERAGECAPADVTTGTGMCGPGTKLEGDRCVSTIECDPATSMPMVDPVTGQTTCVGIGASGCAACPLPASPTKQTICGQIYDFESDLPFRDAGATGQRCPSGATSGPCALKITAYDAIAFGTNPMTATPLNVSDVCIDDEGHYRLQDIDVPPSPLIGLGIDDAAMADAGPMGITNAVGIAVPKIGMSATGGVEHWIVRPSTTASWQASGGPPIANGVFAGVFRAHACPASGCTGDPLAPQAGVVFVKPTGVPYYFGASESIRATIDPVAFMTGANGTGLLTGVSLADGAFSGTGGILDTIDCLWEQHAAVALPYVVFIQIFRKQSQIGKTCAE
jgi:hypothetical protein